MTDQETGKLIVENRSEKINMFTALELCQSVIDEGRISESPNGPMYCAATRFRTRYGDDVVIWADRNKKSDRLVVEDHK